MAKIFISGSMRIKNVHSLVLKRIDNIIFSNFHIFIGDAIGVDASIQKILNEKNYRNVTVFYAGDSPRHNIGDWQVRGVETKHKKNTRLYFTAKDLVMAKKCDYGLMVWDSKSTGTLSNVYEILTQNKRSLIFVNKLKKFYTVSDSSSFERLISVMSEAAFLKADQKIKLKDKLKNRNIIQLQLFEANKRVHADAQQLGVF